MKNASETDTGVKTIRYTIGDATAPHGDGAKVIAHVCNDIGGWGRGFVLAVSKRWPAPEAAYRMWAVEGGETPFALGNTQFVEVADNLWVANMVAQRDVRTVDGVPPIRYDALTATLQQVAGFAIRNGASVHMPRIGCGLAGGDWNIVSTIVTRELVANGVETYLYDLPAQTTTLYRPVGPKELALIQASGMKAFPPRLPDQPVFYPVLNQEYARRSPATGTCAIPDRVSSPVSPCGRTISQSSKSRRSAAACIRSFGCRPSNWRNSTGTSSATSK